MRRFRITIGSLAWLVLFVGVAAAALREANDIWESGVFSFTLGFLLVAVLLSVHRSRERRAFWVGFALFGIVYMIASLIPILESRLLTTKGLTYLASKVPGWNVTNLGVALFDVSNSLSASGSGSFTIAPLNTVAGSTSNPALNLSAWTLNSGAIRPAISSSAENFVRIGHALITLIMALVGACISRRLYARTPRGASERDQTNPAEGTLVAA